MSCVEQCTSSVGIPVRLKGFTFCKPVGPRPKFPLSPRTPDDFNQQISIPQLRFENYLKNRGSKIIFLIIPNLAPFLSYESFDGLLSHIITENMGSC